MRELTLIEKRQVKAAGISGAIINGFGSIIKAGLGFISDMFSHIVTTVFLFKHQNEYKKMDVKLGPDEIKFDRTTETKVKDEPIVYPKAESLI